MKKAEDLEIKEVADVSQALSFTTLRESRVLRTGIPVQVVVDNRPISRCFLKVEAKKQGYAIESLRDLTYIPSGVCRNIVANALGIFSPLIK